MVDTVNHIREINTNLQPIHITTEAGQLCELPALSYRERLALATTLLQDIAKHPSTARHQVASIGTVAHHMKLDSQSNLRAERSEDERIARELEEEAQGKQRGPRF